MTSSVSLGGVPILNETDLALTDALQLNPRVSWTALSEVLELSPVTLARRWQALVRARTAWTCITLEGPRFRGAIIEVACKPGTAVDVAAAFSALPHVATVGITVGEYDLFALVVSPTVDAISAVLLDGLPITPDVTRVSSHVYTGMLGGGRWRHGVLNRAQCEQVRSDLGPPPKELRPLSVDDRALYVALGRDGRRSYTEVAQDLGTSPQVVKRRLDRLQRRGEVAFRCDVARPLAGWHAMAMLWLTAPDAEVGGIGRAIGEWRETRFCAPVVGRTNLCVIVSLRSVEQLEEIVLRLAAEYPQVTIAERRLVLRQVKVHGRLVDEHGRSTEVIPVDPWGMLAGRA
ncbi:Lrp/AsnC family transcriptional regulator [Streptomyces griseoaurantiacus]|uniref:DNA-binding transcriptional regulator, Lrp family n=1 Tax=Streptomyces griseoaurantiacus TaxID=68213 RepID=A0A1G7SMS7_9ACTN|nr:Lrp/AsnC family transcriptional regulator [Streptomyces jietaisiensis]SDG24212.1 DNA-binding transcriptional regulator, Lrp family [Streptomyces jietaisiensis]